jgi:tetratricopeptide (TPR) repeat protein
MSSRARTVADLLLRHAEAHTSGVMTLSRGQVKKQLYLHDGVLVSADSNLREEALGAVMVTLGLLPASRLNELLAEVKRRGQKMGRVLTDLDWVSPDDVLTALAEQVRWRAVSCLRWTEAETSFEATSAFVGGLIEHRFAVAPLVFAGLRDTCTLDLLAATLDQESGHALRLSDRFVQYREDFVAAFGPHVAEVLERGLEIAQLVLRPDASVLAYGLDALIVSNLTELADQPRSRDQFTSEKTARDLTPLGLDALAELARSPTTAAGARAALRASGGSGGTGAAEPELPDDLKKEYLEIHGRSPEDVLGVAADATQQQISRAYEDKRARIVELATVAPHRQMLEEMLESYARARAALAKGHAEAEGWTASSTMAGRMTDARMDPLGAELAFVEGRTLLDADNFAEAVPHLQQAVDSRPDQAAYHAWLGWALWRARGTASRDEARDRLEHALALDPDSTEAHALMGSFLSAIEEPEGARPHLERTLMLRPDQPEAADQLVVIYLRAGEPDLAEKLYRRLIGALADREPALRARWWEQLARLYKGPLADPAAAARAVESAAQIAAG